MKKTTPDHYAKAFLEITRGTSLVETEKAISVFLSLLQSNGDWHKRKEIFAACARRWRAEHGISHIIVESARALAPTQHEALRALFKNGRFEFEERITPSLVAGVRITKNEDQEFDYSFAHILKSLFRVARS